MRSDNPFLPALLAEPDDTLRLALADWLDEYNQPARAEFIRVQIELARGGGDPDRRSYLDQRQRDLRAAHEAEWIAPLEAVLGSRFGSYREWGFRRGCVEYFHLSVGTLVARGARLAELTPVRELHLNADWRLGELWRQPWLRSVTHLSGLDLSDEAAQAMIACPHLTGLRVLRCKWEHLDVRNRRWFVRRFGHALPPD